MGKEDDHRVVDEQRVKELNRIKYQCMHCRYQFSLKQDSSVERRCPNCGRKQLMEVKKHKDVNDLIEEASDSKYDY